MCFKDTKGKKVESESDSVLLGLKKIVSFNVISLDFDAMEYIKQLL